MIDENIEIVENEYVELLNQILEQRKDEINKANLTYGQMDFKREYSTDNSYTSEVVLDFYFEGRLFDVIEFFIYRHDKLMSSYEETRSWIINVVDDIISSRSGR